jgi:multidrug efflux pump subunit AcrB
VFSRGEEDILNNTSLLNSYAETFNAENSLFSLVVVEDKGISLSDAISSLQNNAWQGMLLVLIVLGLFLDPRIAFWVAFKIPVALLGMFTLGYLYDLTINQVSLFGTIIVLGVIVDDGVVVAENIYDKYLKGKSPLHAALEGVLEVVPSVISSLITTALAFSIFFFFDGQLGDYFSDVSFVVCTTLCIALLESLLFLPVHIARSKALGAGYKPWKITEVTNASLIRFRDRYFTRIITFSLNRPVWPIVIVFVGMGLTIAALGSGTIKSTFFPTIDQDMITAELELEPGTDERILLEKLDRIESAVWEVNDEFSSLREDSLSVVTFVEKVLTPNSNEGYLSIYLLESDKRDLLSYEISARIREKVGPMPEARNVAFKSLNAFGKPVSIALISPDAEELAQAKVLLRAALEKRSDLKDITDTDKQGTPEVLLTLKERSRLLGLNEAQIFDQVRKGFFGLEAQSLQRGDEEVKIWIRYDAKDRASLYQLASMRITGPDGSSYPLEELVDFTTQWSTTQIHHQSGVREIRVEADVANLMVSVPAVLAEAEAGVLAEIQDRFPSIRYTLEGEARLSSKTQASSQGPSILVLILILVILMLNYRSVGKTFAIMAMLPFAFIGVAWGTFIHQIPVSIFSFLGLIALWGILINNGLVLVSTFNDNLQAGLRIKEAMADAVISRFRPIVLTTITTVFGLAPLLLSNSISSQFIQPTAIAIAYGLIFGLVLSLTFLPAVLLLLSKVKTILARRWSRNPTIQPEELDVVLKEAKNQLL